MTLTQAQLQALKTKISGDATLTAHAAAGRWIEIAAALNSAVEGTIDRARLSRRDIRRAVVGSEWVGLSQDRRDFFQILMLDEEFEIKNTTDRAHLQAIFQGSATTLSNLADMETKNANWAEVATGVDGAALTAENCQEAMAL